jgi:glycosyltransferase involved in cell wall biosynthesis
MGAFELGDGSGGYLLFFGRIHPDKGAVEALDLADRTGLPLLLAGIVQDERYYDELVAPRVDGGRIPYLGAVGPDRRGELLGRARALVHLVNFDEPFGFSVVEAMASGTPVVARPRGSLPELVQPGENGFLAASLDEAAAAVDAAPGLDRARVRASVEERFAAGRMVDDHIDLYRRLV